MTYLTSVRLGIIGLGNMGSTHASAIRAGRVPGLVLAAVADHAPARLEAFKGIPAFLTAEDLLHSGLIDAVLIATPHFSHTDIGIQALKTGLHVLIEKPIAVHKQDCKRLLAAHRPNSGQVFGVMLNQRTDPRYQKLKELLSNGTLGAVQRINWIITDWYRPDCYYRLSDWRATWAGEGGGVLLNQAPHQLDLWQWLFGMPQTVLARCQFGRHHDIEVEDSVTALLEYPSGTQGVFITSTGEAPGTNRLEVVGENGRLVIEDGGPIHFLRNEVSSQENLRSSVHPFRKPPLWKIEIPTPGVGSQHVGILTNFTRAIKGSEALISPASEGVNSVELANAMLLSTLQGRPVKLPLDGAAYVRALAPLIARSRYKQMPVSAVKPVPDLSQYC